jgi:hypothetical protein
LIIEGSTIFNNNEMIFEGGIPKRSHEYVPRGKKREESKDMTNDSNVYRNKKGKYFQCKI